MPISIKAAKIIESIASFNKTRQDRIGGVPKNKANGNHTIADFPTETTQPETPSLTAVEHITGNGYGRTFSGEEHVSNR